MGKEKLIIPSESESEKSFAEILDTTFGTDVSDFERVFQAGIDLMIKLNSEDKVRLYDELGFDIDLVEVLKRLGDEEEQGYDELYGFNIIEITDVKFNSSNSVPREMTIIFSAEENSGPLYTDLSIKINSYG